MLLYGPFMMMMMMMMRMLILPVDALVGSLHDDADDDDADADVAC